MNVATKRKKVSSELLKKWADDKKMNFAPLEWFAQADELTKKLSEEQLDAFLNIGK